MQTTSQTGANSLWSSLAKDRFHWENWGEQYAIFDSFSGETHLLPLLTAYTLKALSHRDCSTRQLAESLRGVIDESSDEQLMQAINQQLKQLQALGLVMEMRTQ